ncbi:MAG: winged helix-turn-helix domain-containing protein, partial [Syntrophales bacterium]|nr:winged helix-turn-helix domain-containing protein [Syntrophales bacterium]
LKLIEENRRYKINCLGEPQLGRRGLYPTISKKYSADKVKKMMDFIAYADGVNDIIDISNKTNIPIWELYSVIEKLTESGLITAV